MGGGIPLDKNDKHRSIGVMPDWVNIFWGQCQWGNWRSANLKKGSNLSKLADTRLTQIGKKCPNGSNQIFTRTMYLSGLTTYISKLEAEKKVV